MIPRKIHYCWFGGKEKPAEVLRYMDTWQKHCPDYEIKEWNESNFNINLNRYTREAYDAGKWAFVSDVARLWALVNDGGIYMDTDVEVMRSLDALLHEKAFIGFEGTRWIGTNILGAEKGNSFLKKFLESYNDRVFIDEKGKTIQTTNVEEITNRFIAEHNICMDGKKQSAGDFTIYPTDYFSPYDYIDGRTKATENTYSIHRFSQSWIKRSRLVTLLSQWWHRLCGMKMK